MRWLDASLPDGGDAHVHGAVRSMCLTAEDPLDWTCLGLWLSMLLNRHGDRVLRVKGILNIAGVSTPVVIHGVQHLIHKPVHLDAWPDADRSTRIVVIVDGLDLAAVRRSFAAFQRLAPGAAASEPPRLRA
jgi:G3E family GTPase